MPLPAGPAAMRVRAASQFKQALWRLSLRAPGDIVEQAAMAGALAPGASDENATQAAARLNIIAEEGEGLKAPRDDIGDVIAEPLNHGIQ